MMVTGIQEGLSRGLANDMMFAVFSPGCDLDLTVMNHPESHGDEVKWKM
jgi:hypothetical protein